MLFGNLVEYDTLSDLCDFLCSSVNHVKITFTTSFEDYVSYAVVDHGLSRQGQGNQDISKGANRRQCQARKSMAI